MVQAQVVEEDDRLLVHHKVQMWALNMIFAENRPIIVNIKKCVKIMSLSLDIHHHGQVKHIILIHIGCAMSV